ncbi:MAG: disulfide bond formation protein B [Roseiflexaceae bacterium]|nr:disulfide bond formation protein B [Roseiflexaceae bacterium]
MAQIGGVSRYIALLAAWIATSGSLFFSEVLGWIPCSLCWYQRILMYPLSIIIAIGLLRRDARLHTYALPFSLLGAAVSTYHYLLQKTDWLPPPACAMGVPCSTDYINWLGFVTIPFLALTAFLIISLMLVTSLLTSASAEDQAVAAAASPGIGIGYDHVAVVAIIGTVVLGFIIAAQLLY